MAQQMTLFPGKDASDENAASWEGNGNVLDEAFGVLYRFGSIRDYVQMLRFIGRFRGYSPYNGFLLYVQRPDATHVAAARTWQRRFRRTVKPGARPLLILAPMAPVRFVFDFADTEGEPLRPQQLSREPGARGFSEDVFVNTIHNCSLHGIMVRQARIAGAGAGSAIPLTDENIRQHPEAALDAGMHYLILLNQEHRPQDKYAALACELGNIFCGHRGIDREAWWPDRRRIDEGRARLEAESVAFLVCLRSGLSAEAGAFLKQRRDQDPILPLPALSAVLQAASYVEEMGRSRWPKPKRSRRVVG